MESINHGAYPSINVLLLAAGEGTRLRPITETTPKCLVHILDRPLMEYWFALLKTGPHINECWVNLGYLKTVVDQYLNSQVPHLPFKVQRFYETALLGTAGTLRAIGAAVNTGEHLLLAHADNLTWFSLPDFFAAHLQRPEGCQITMLTFTTDNPQSCGIVEIDSKSVIQGFHEKTKNPPGNLANGAVYLISPAALTEIIEAGTAHDFSLDVLPKFIGRAQIWHNSVYHRDIGTLSSLQSAQEEFQHIRKKYNILSN
jgi:mannose-1-phosphate guanylyltransferase